MSDNALTIDDYLTEYPFKNEQTIPVGKYQKMSCADNIIFFAFCQNNQILGLIMGLF